MILALSFLLFLLSHDLDTSSSFQIITTTARQSSSSGSRCIIAVPTLLLVRRKKVTELHSTFASDGSDYADDGGGEDDDIAEESSWYRGGSGEDDDDEKMFGGGVPDEDDDTPTEELSPVPLSKNAGNKFMAIVWDRLLHRDPSNVVEMHEERIELTEDHVLFCRKKNLYNETFNSDSMVDIMWSYQILSSDVQRVIGHAMCLESTELHHVQQVLSEDPIVQRLTGGDISKIPLYRWRHIRDSTLRMDDGRFGCPCMCLALDNRDNTCRNVENQNKQLEYLIRSQKVIAAGPLHPPTERKEENWAIGDVILFNAKDRDDAVNFAENLPLAKDGVYQSLRVHFYNTLDITGKFVSENLLKENPMSDMKEAMEVWGYPVDDKQTPWLNW